MYVMKEKAYGGDISFERRLYGKADPGPCIYGAVVFNRSWPWTKNCLLFLLPRQGTKENKNKNKVI